MHLIDTHTHLYVEEFDEDTLHMRQLLKTELTE